MHTRLSGLKDVCDLTLSNPTHAGFQYPEQALQEAFACAVGPVYDANPQGLYSTRSFLAEHAIPLGRATSPEQMLCTASTSEAYSYALKACCNPGDAVAVGVPGYPLVPVLAELEGVRTLYFRYVYEGRWRLDLQSVCDVLKQGVKALVLVEPNNPTGVFLDEEDRKQVQRLCAQYGCVLWVDEVFAGYVWDRGEVKANLWDMHAMPLVFVMDGVSKRLCLPHVKLGWISVYGEKRWVFEALERLAWIADAYLSVGQPVQRALPALWGVCKQVHADVLARVVKHRALLLEQVACVPEVSVLHADAGWVSVLRVPAVVGSERWAERLLERAFVHVQHGGLYGFSQEGFLVVSMLPSEKVFLKGCERLLEGIASVIKEEGG